MDLQDELEKAKEQMAVIPSPPDNVIVQQKYWQDVCSEVIRLNLLLMDAVNLLDQVVYEAVHIQDVRTDEEEQLWDKAYKFIQKHKGTP